MKYTSLFWYSILIIFSQLNCSNRIVEHRKRNLRGRIAHTIIEQEPAKKISKKIFLYKNFKSIDHICYIYPSFQETAKALGYFAKKDQYLKKIIQKSIRDLSLIKKLSRRFDCSDMFVVHHLSFRESHYRYLMQTYLYESHLSKNELSYLKAKGLYLDFTYGGRQETALMGAINSYKNATQPVLQKEKIFLLVKNGADINKPNKWGNNPVALALQEYKKEYITLFLGHSALNACHKDVYGSTLLHRCVYAMLQNFAFRTGKNDAAEREYDFMFDVMTQLLAKGANPTSQDDTKRTPLQFAREESGKELPFSTKHSKYYKNIISQKIIALLQDAQAKWKNSYTI